MWGYPLGITTTGVFLAGFEFIKIWEGIADDFFAGGAASSVGCFLEQSVIISNEVESQRCPLDGPKPPSPLICGRVVGKKAV